MAQLLSTQLLRNDTKPGGIQTDKHISRDWRKFDLSTDVIRFASPKVSEINLYWRGNQTVLKGWANEDGIPRLFSDSEKTLKAVTIHWSPVSINLRSFIQDALHHRYDPLLLDESKFRI